MVSLLAEQSPDPPGRFDEMGIGIEPFAKMRFIRRVARLAERTNRLGQKTWELPVPA
jgi:hypothetical protein